MTSAVIYARYSSDNQREPRLKVKSGNVQNLRCGMV